MIGASNTAPPTLAAAADSGGTVVMCPTGTTAEVTVARGGGQDTVLVICKARCC